MSIPNFPDKNNHRNEEIMNLRSQGMTMQAIAEKLGIGIMTVCRNVPHTNGKNCTKEVWEKRFLKKVDKSCPNGCWNWLGGKTVDGYGQIRKNHKRVYAHRVSCEIFHGPIPEEMEVCHKCDNPSCVNPDHLFIGTHADNMHDRDRKGRGRKPRTEKAIC